MCDYKCSFGFTVPSDYDYSSEDSDEESIKKEKNKKSKKEKTIIKFMDDTQEIPKRVDATTLLCGNIVVDGSTKCIFHKCGVVGCENSKWHNKKYCEKHVCKYYDDQECSELRIDDSCFCGKHKCKNCNERIYYGKVKFCKTHLTEMICEFKGCENTFPFKQPEKIFSVAGVTFVNMDEGVSMFSPLRCCSEHTCESCHKFEIAGTNTRYCHRCVKKEDPEWENDEDNYCQGHCCSRRKEIGDYCREHVCEYDGCNGEKMDTIVEMGDVIFDSRYCRKHHTIDQVCKSNFGFGLDALKIFNFLDESDFNPESNKLKILKRALKQAS